MQGLSPIHQRGGSATGLRAGPNCMSDSSRVEYFLPSRRFILGAVTYYAGPDVWVYEISPYDTASAAMVQTAYEAIAAAAWFGPKLVFHPTSEAIELEAALLPASVKVMHTEELFAGITYQALNVATAIGRLRFTTAAEAEIGPLDFRDLVVLDSIPNDIGVVAGIITATFQTALSHINVLSQNRGTPNMALLGVFEDPTLRALDGRWVELRVGLFDWSVREVTQAESDAWWEASMTHFSSTTAWSRAATSRVRSAAINSPSEPPVLAVVSRITKRMGVPGTSNV